MGPGWITALKGTSQSMGTYSLPTKLGYILASVAQAQHVPVSTGLVVAVTRTIGLMAAALLSLVLVLRSPRIGIVRAFAFSSLAIVMLGPVVWPWYLATGFAFLAASGVGKWRPTVIVLIASASLLVWPTSVPPLDSLQHYQALLSPLVLAAVVGGCYIGQRLARRPTEPVESAESAAPAPETDLLAVG